MFSKTSHQLSPLHSEISISCLSLGTAVLSAESSTINICISNHGLKFLERLTLAHHARHLLQSPNEPTVVGPVLECKLFHGFSLAVRLEHAKKEQLGSGERHPEIAPGVLEKLRRKNPEVRIRLG
jgi:hypothetical protein